MADHHDIGAVPDEFFDFDPNFTQIPPHVAENRGGRAAPFFDEAEKNMFRTDIFVVKPLRFLVCQHHHLPRTFGKSF